MRVFLFGTAACLVALVGVGACGENFESGGSGSGGSGNQGKACDTVADCDEPSSACVNVTCQLGVCVETALGDGPLPANRQEAGDCHTLTCENGKVEEVVDDTDLPRDGNDCTEDVCEDGDPSHPQKAPGTPCGDTGNLACNDDGLCAGCTASTDCGTNGPCIMHHCNAGICEEQYAAQGTVLPAAGQTPGDCKTMVCDGQGDVVASEADDPPMSTPGTCEQKICVGTNPDSVIIGDGKNCVGSTTQICCMGTCCSGDALCSTSGCANNTGGAGGTSPSP